MIRRSAQPKINKRMFVFTILAWFRKGWVTKHETNFYRTGSSVRTHHKLWFSARLFFPNGVRYIWTLNKFLIELHSILKMYVLIKIVSKVTICRMIIRQLSPFPGTFRKLKNAPSATALIRDVLVRCGLDKAQDVWRSFEATHQWFRIPSRFNCDHNMCRDEKKHSACQ